MRIILGTHASESVDATQKLIASIERSGLDRRLFSSGLLATNLWSSRYELRGLIAAGAQGAVFDVVDTESGARCAAKVFDLSRARDWDDEKLFEREAAVLRALQHPLIPAFVDVLRDDSVGVRVIVMERFRGETLEVVANEQRAIDVGHAGWMMADVLNALAALHAQGIVHRDIKPTNLLLCADATVRLIDFGGVGFVQGKGSTLGVGTLGYVAPEQLHGAHSPRSDLFSLAVTMLSVLSGKAANELPRKGLSLSIDVERAVPALPKPLRKLLASMSAPDPEGRPADAREVAAALGSYALTGRPPAQAEATFPRVAPRKNTVTRQASADNAEGFYERLERLAAERDLSLRTGTRQWTAAVRPYSRRAGAFLERVSLERPQLSLAGLLVELSAPEQRSPLVEKLEASLEAFLSKRPAPAFRAAPEFFLVDDALLELEGRLRGVVRSPRIARVGMQESPPALVYEDVRANAAVALFLDRLETRFAKLVSIRGPALSKDVELDAITRMRDIVLEPISDEAARLRRLLDPVASHTHPPPKDPPPAPKLAPLETRESMSNAKRSENDREQTPFLRVTPADRLQQAERRAHGDHVQRDKFHFLWRETPQRRGTTDVPTRADRPRPREHWIEVSKTVLSSAPGFKPDLRVSYFDAAGQCIGIESLQPTDRDSFARWWKSRAGQRPTPGDTESALLRETELVQHATLAMVAPELSEDRRLLVLVVNGKELKPGGARIVAR